MLSHMDEIAWGLMWCPAECSLLTMFFRSSICDIAAKYIHYKNLPMILRMAKRQLSTAKINNHKLKDYEYSHKIQQHL